MKLDRGAFIHPAFIPRILTSLASTNETGTDHTCEEGSTGNGRSDTITIAITTISTSGGCSIIVECPLEIRATRVAELSIRSQADVPGGTSLSSSAVAQVTTTTRFVLAVSIALSTCLSCTATTAIGRESVLADETTRTVTAVAVSTTLGASAGVIVEATGASVGITARGRTGVAVESTVDTVEAAGVRTLRAVRAGGGVTVITVGATGRAGARDHTKTGGAGGTRSSARARQAVKVVASDRGDT